MAVEIELSPVDDFDRLGELWQDLEKRADGSFFQSWAWVGCEAAQRFGNPLLLLARDNGAVVALGLFNRRRRLSGSVLLLSESGRAQYDSVFVEHNGILVERGRGDALIAECLRWAMTGGGRGPSRTAGRIVLSGVPERYLAVLGGETQRVAIHAASPSHFIDLAALRAAGAAYLAQLSANTRYQLRRSRRRYAAEGALTLRRAASIAEARDFLSGLAALHQQHWTRRGKPGAFATAPFRRFHHALIERAFPAGAIDLLQIACGERVVGYLYNFRYRGVVFAYQSGFDYSPAGRHCHPGLTCHHLAIEAYLADGAERYDFLAGADRYKSSLATGAANLYWLELRRRARVFAGRRGVADLVGLAPYRPAP